MSGWQEMHIQRANFWSAAVSTTLLAVVGWLLARAVYRVTLHPLAKVPGPWSARMSMLWQFHQDVILGGTITYTLQDLHRRHGPVVRIGPNHLSVADADFGLQFVRLLVRPRHEADISTAYC
jgi:hypothetical protein